MICIILNMVSKQELLSKRVITFWLNSYNKKVCYKANHFKKDTYT